MKRTPILIAAAVLSAASYADTVVLKNGDRLSGEIVAKTDESISLKTAYGPFVIPASDVESVLAAEEAAKPAAAVAAAPAPAPAPAAPEPERTWVDDYRDFIHSNVPEGWEFKIKGGLERRETSSKTLSYTLGFDAHKMWDDVHDFKFSAYYDYASETPENGVENKTTDKYGVVTNYKYYISPETWYLSNTLSYGVDRIKGIKDQVDEIVGVGRTIKPLGDDTLIINVSAGPAARYVNADDYDQHWAAMATVMQDLVWKFHDYARLEESAFAGVNVLNVNKYNYVFNIGIVFELTDLLNIAGRYSYSYDGVNASSAQKTEERFIISFEIPFK